MHATHYDLTGLRRFVPDLPLGVQDPAIIMKAIEACEAPPYGSIIAELHRIGLTGLIEPVAVLENEAADRTWGTSKSKLFA